MLPCQKSVIFYFGYLFAIGFPKSSPQTTQKNNTKSYMVEGHHVQFQAQAPVMTTKDVPVEVDELKQWHYMTVEDVCETLEVTDLSQGLSAAGVTRRQKIYGDNQIAVNKSKVPLWIRLLFRHSVNLMTFVLLFAAIISAVVQDWVDMGGMYIGRII
jgi:magnesium-transporting ATPase (P-type)